MIPAICSAPQVTADSTVSLLTRIFWSTSTTTSELWMVPPLGLIFQVAPSRIVEERWIAGQRGNRRQVQPRHRHQVADILIFLEAEPDQLLRPVGVGRG